MGRQARLLPRALGAQGQRQASFLGGIFGSGEKKAGIATEATFDYRSFKLHQLDEGPATTTSITRDEALRIYREMVSIRRMETAAANLYKEKAIRGFCHLCSGQEAVYSGMKAGIREQDSIITSYRIIGAELAETSEIKAIELEVKQSVDADVKKAKTDGEIGEEELYYDIYENNLGGKVRGIFSKDAHEHKKTQQAINV